ncbi:hypothetical protein AVEN_22661-1 [Araneus ventricosus]|uniref:Uncharacterized protein n=1 Tax=Araneus ventricosus TaxID=182803 RepID=A0A4Y2QV40_ARAVE|nr:hypothetical protein AVEN_22661-1 [Araneus ventricosus]
MGVPSGPYIAVMPVDGKSIDVKLRMSRDRLNEAGGRGRLRSSREEPAYIPESDVKLHLTSILPQRFPVRHSVRRIDFPSCGTYLDRKPKITRTPQASQSKPVKGC